jgi:small subunit ribosomal protein S4
VKAGDVITVSEKSKETPKFKEAIETLGQKSVPAWLELDAAAATGRVARYPNREEIDIPVQEQMIVELYSR